VKPTRNPEDTGRPLLDPWRFPLGPQTGSTAAREKVRESARPVRAPRESKRRVERTK